jgi:hypothetical protein
MGNDGSRGSEEREATGRPGGCRKDSRGRVEDVLVCLRVTTSVKGFQLRFKSSGKGEIGNILACVRLACVRLAFCVPSGGWMRAWVRVWLEREAGSCAEQPAQPHPTHPTLRPSHNPPTPYPAPATTLPWALRWGPAPAKPEPVQLKNVRSQPQKTCCSRWCGRRGRGRSIPPPSHTHTHTPRHSSKTLALDPSPRLSPAHLQSAPNVCHQSFAACRPRHQIVSPMGPQTGQRPSPISCVTK